MYEVGRLALKLADFLNLLNPEINLFEHGAIIRTIIVCIIVPCVDVRK